MVRALDAQVLDASVLAAYVQGELSAATRAKVEAALDRDPQSLAVVAALAKRAVSRCETGDRPNDNASTDEGAAQRPDEARVPPLLAGTRVGRYEIVRPLGRGGMGVVLEVHDPQLDRNIALKLLAPTANPEQVRERLRREATALAQLNHPNVVSIFDAGELDGRAFVAMELIDGPTLQRWCQAQRRGWADIVRTFIAAGEGLAAAHALGLVHRDFKPSNVMVTEAGRVVVLDFGLARIIGTQARETDPSSREEPVPSSATQTGQVLGTLAYMAPEQRRGAPCGPAADQFSFCVALHEALFGSLPSQPHGPDAAGPAPSSRISRWRVPRPLGPLLARGLHPDATQRYASMSDLLAALERILKARRRVSLQRAVAAGAGSVIGILLLVAASPESARPCDADARLVDVWDDSRSAQLHRKLTASSAAWGKDVDTDTQRQLDSYAADWKREYQSTCQTPARGVALPTHVRDRQMACLEQRRRSLAAVVGVLAVVDPQSAAQSPRTVAALPSVSSCSDTVALWKKQPLPKGLLAHQDAAELAERVTQVESFRRAKQLGQARASSREMLAIAHRLDHDPSEAEARLVAGSVLVDLGDYFEAEDEFRAALSAALSGKHDQAVVAASIELGFVVGHHLGRAEEARDLARLADAWSERVGRLPHHEVKRMRLLGRIEHDAGNSGLAVQHFQRALGLVEDLPPEDPGTDFTRVRVLNGLATAAEVEGNLQLAHASMQSAVATLQTHLGDRHPDLATLLISLAKLARREGNYDDSLKFLERSHDLVEEGLGPRHPQLGIVEANLAVTHVNLDHADIAADYARRALEILRAARGADHRVTARTEGILAEALLRLGHTEEGLGVYRNAIDRLTEHVGAKHADVGQHLVQLATAQLRLGRFDDARQTYEHGMAVLEAARGSEHPSLISALLGLGQLCMIADESRDGLRYFERATGVAGPPFLAYAHMRRGQALRVLGRLREAETHLELARALDVGRRSGPAFGAELLADLADVRWQLGQDPRAARSLAETALEIFGDEELERQRNEVLQWLEEHPAPPAR